MSKWISVEDRLPEELPEDLGRFGRQWVDVWVAGKRTPDVIFFKGSFNRMIEDRDGNFSHFEEICEVSHWLKPESPKE